MPHLNSDPNDPDVIIEIDIVNAFNVLCHQLTLDDLGNGPVVYLAFKNSSRFERFPRKVGNTACPLV
jgi:hypothetical protein